MQSPYLRRQRRDRIIADIGYVCIMVISTAFAIGLLWAATK